MAVQDEAKKSKDDEPEFDTIIVGGGISGLYCARELIKATSDASRIALFEASDRLGGKIESWRFVGNDYRSECSEGSLTEKNRSRLETMLNCDREIRNARNNRKNGATRQKRLEKILRQNFFAHKRMLDEILVAEFGPMRIEPEHQPLLKKLLDDLDFQEEDPQCPTWSDLVPFSPYTGEPPPHPAYPLEGEEAEQETMIDLLLLAFRRIFENIDSYYFWDDEDCDAHANGPKRKNQGQASFDADHTCSDPRCSNEPALAYFWGEMTDTNYVHRQQWKRHVRNWINCLADEHYHFIRLHFSFKGTPLCDMGFWNLIASVLSHMATIKLRDWGSFYHLLGDNPNAAEWLIFWLRALKSSNSLVGIRGGMDWLIYRICEDLGLPQAPYPPLKEEDSVMGYTGEKRFKFFPDHKLMAIKEKAKHVVLYFDGEKKKVTAKNVILALPKGPLQSIVFKKAQPQWINAFERILDSIAPIPLMKLFVLIDRPFWEDNRPANRYAYTVPTREIHYWKAEGGKTGLIMLYTDDPGHEFWANYLVHPKPYSSPRGDLADVPESQSDQSKKTGEALIDSLTKTKGVRVPPRDQKRANLFFWQAKNGAWHEFTNDRLLRTFIAYVRENHSDSVPDNQILAAGIRDWSLRPAEGATHFWRPGADSESVMNYLRSFSSISSAEGRIHVCGEAYSDYQGFIEGALRSARKLLDSAPFGNTQAGKKDSKQPNIRACYAKTEKLNRVGVTADKPQKNKQKRPKPR